MFVAYERSALGELLAGAWFPLMVLFALRTRSSIAPLGLSVAALWLTNSPAAVMGSYLLAVLALGMWIAEGRPWPALRAVGGMALGLGLAAFYIVPAAFEQRWVQIERAIIPGMRVEDSFLFAHTADAFHDQVLRTASWIFIAEVAVASIAAYLAWRKRAGGRARIALTASLPVILLLQLPVSDVIWKHAPHLKFLQFPWRWPLALSVVACVLAGMALEKSGPVASAGGSSDSRGSDRRHGHRRRYCCSSSPATTRMRWRHRSPASAWGKARKAPTSTRLWGLTTHPCNNTCPWCACCVRRRMTPPTAPRGITRSGEPETRAASRPR